ncbi:lysophospholipid acyltransferase family protein [Hoeflea olei]|uniref:Acyl-phosphate glycerol 3-phosphate acyltransferase n=1 Tax=Hoeflea olei TaxID=1480615 RepID=A0A1C1YQU0_9HYPH|nr:1-acyl-sn-glycerol-3-phosphate acyltransferase [Hoeflea olei]OCW55902.1 acyl-phosphate glycerol 3-phosphate acyltransferase [Hoeflea olei]
MIAGLRIALVGLVFALLTLALLPVQLAALGLGHPLMRRLPRWWHSLMCRAIGLRVRSHGRLSTARPLLLVSNHVSWKDILVLGSVADVVFIAKSEVRTWPLLGWLARLQRSVFVERQQRRKTGAQVSEVSQRLIAGEVVVLFAEGTTSDGNRVMPFNASLFGAASAAVAVAPEGRVHIQPVSIAYVGLHGMPMGRYHRPVAGWPGDVALGPHLLKVLRHGALDVDVIFAEPVAFDAGTDRKKTARLVEARVRDGLIRALGGRLDAG